MLVRVLAIGRLKAGPERELVERYRSRALATGRSLGFQGPEIIELTEGRDRRTEDRQADEATRIGERLDGSIVAILDETASSLSSEAFAARLGAMRDKCDTHLTFAIGGPDGFAAGLKTRADWSISFGRLTLPHQIVRVLLLEQIYRAFTILSGHPYHRGGGADG